MKLFTCGPVQMFPSVANVRNQEYIHFRTKQYGDMVLNILNKLSQLLDNSCKNSLIYLASSGTGAMEATVQNCILTNDKSLVINGGGFGKRFCEFLEYHNKNYTSLDLKWNETLTPKHLEKYEDKGYTTLFVNIHETTSGQLYDLKMISDFCKKNNMFLIVDAISSFLADNYSIDKHGIDVTIISSQKGLSCSPGCSFISLSKRMIDKINSNDIKTSAKYFDFKDYLINIPRGQTPYTPPVFVMYEIQEMLNLIDKAGGKDKWIEEIKKKKDYFSKKAKENGLLIPNYPISNMLTSLYFEDIDAYQIIVKLNEQGIYINPCGGELATKLVRVSHIGNTSIEDIDYLFEKMLPIIQEIKREI